MGAASDRGWNALAATYARVGSPLKPCSGDAALVAEGVKGHAGDMLLLGVTPVLASFGRRLVAVDHSEDMIRHVWPGDGPDRMAVKGVWDNLPLPDASIDAVVGDGAFSAFDFAPERLMSELRRVMKPGGVAALRCFCTPNPSETTATLLAALDRGEIPELNIFKWRLAMQLAAQDPNFRVPVAEILQQFNELFPDKEALLARSGWDRAEFDFIDGYASQRHALRFLPEAPLLSRCRKVFPATRVLRPSGYVLAERCPVFVLAE